MNGNINYYMSLAIGCVLVNSCNTPSDSVKKVEIRLVINEQKQKLLISKTNELMSASKSAPLGVSHEIIYMNGAPLVDLTYTFSSRQLNIVRMNADIYFSVITDFN